ncbi:MAG TPA: hypothetical protein DCF33_14205 [Saprospirales bacterium]|nr:hypothetical protein [Saprospirales bacterium]
MRHISFFFLLLGSSVSISGQNSGGGFHYNYNLSSQSNWGTRFSNVICKEDTLWILGNAYTAESVPFEAVVLAKLDTLGTLLDTSYFNLNNDDIIVTEGNDVLTLQNGNFASIGVSFAGHQASLSIFNNVGNPIFHKLYGINGAFTLDANRLLEANTGGYLLAGYYQKSDYTLKGFIKRISPSGNQIWSRTYGQPGQNTLQSTIHSLTQLDSNTFVVGSNQYSPQGTALTNYTANSWIFAIDTLGLVKWEWKSPDKAEVGVFGLQKTIDNGWIYLTGTMEIISAEESGTYLKVIRRDSALNLLWERTISDLGPTINRFGDLVPTPDGNWVASGTWIYRTGPGQDDVVFYSSLYKLNDQGDTLWSVRLKAPPGFEGTAYPGGMTVLPSGSVVWALRFDRFSPGPPQSFGWLIKVDNDGCVDTLCQLSSIAPEPLAAPLIVYPNPAQTSVTFEWPDQSAPAQLNIFDMTGRIVWTQTFHQKTVWEAADTPGGVYFYSIVGETLEKMSGKVLLVRGGQE